MQHTALFSTLLLEDYLHLDNKSIVDACYRMKKAQTWGEQDGGWQSDWMIDDPAFKELKDAVSNMFKKVQEEYYTINCPIQIKNEWVNINYPAGATTNINMVHMHDRNVLSCVYYAQASEKCGNLTLFSPHQLYDQAVPYRYIKSPNEWNSTRFRIKPETGKLVCFPSYLLHNAGKNMSNRDRISIAFNGDINDGSFM